ncbi:acetyltransferase (GNAT) family protein [Rhizobium sp. PP-CC-3G-465]|nr:acetyltransferase (GNAT) family protein [Rhizobium sp. PP-CC-2G-626]TCQ27568.1 acetyltransferase (GNAT) family protein [Rhizobium sp. PP-CC-3G-465]
MSAERHLELARHYFSWVAVDEDDFPTGFLRAERAGDEMHIWEISVSANRQGEGMGLASLQKAIAEARDTRFLAVTLTTFSEVPWNAPFYQRLGFQKLAADDVGKRLNGLLQVEVDHGLPIAQRCAMRLML